MFLLNSANSVTNIKIRFNRFSQFAEFGEFNESSALFMENPNVKVDNARALN